VGAAVAATGAGILGVILGLTMPRGPVTTAQALIAMLVSLLVGGIAGLVMRSRWAMLLAPAVFMVVFELVRVGRTGRRSTRSGYPTPTESSRSSSAAVSPVC
jgi:hypothetical protein